MKTARESLVEFEGFDVSVGFASNTAEWRWHIACFMGGDKIHIDGFKKTLS